MWKHPEGDSHFLYGDGSGYTLSGGAYSHSLGYGLDHHGRHGHHGHHGHHDHHYGQHDHHSSHSWLGRRSHHHDMASHHPHHAAHGLGHHDPYYGTGVSGMLPVVELKVQMRSERSRKVITKKLAKLKGVVSVDVDLYQQKVTVSGYASPSDVLKKVRKTGREAHFWTDQTMYTSYTPPLGGYPAGGYAAGY
eukprot:TRINITY_DN76_c0_g1_i1.p1 TRINITY_DN76_c0_g1~~TRINITY_DN76_c0_g1_i1.p1  ORF type:complete len:192 (+),score=3.24 TRINITY_DN76_c0_g1_i1:269-844(+)